MNIGQCDPSAVKWEITILKRSYGVNHLPGCQGSSRSYAERRRYLARRYLGRRKMSAVETNGWQGRFLIAACRRRFCSRITTRSRSWTLYRFMEDSTTA